MRNMIVTIHMTLDGVMEAPRQWDSPFRSADVKQSDYDQLFASDALLLGRVTYQEFADACHP